MKKWKTFILVLLFFLQFSFAPFVLRSQFGINFLLIFCVVLFFSFEKSLKKNLIWVLLAGLLFDYFSYNFFGLGIFVFLTTSLIIFLISQRVIREDRSFLLEFFSVIFIKIIFDFQFWFLSHYSFHFFNKLGLDISFTRIFNSGYLISLVIFYLFTTAILYFVNKIVKNKASKLIIK